MEIDAGLERNNYVKIPRMNPDDFQKRAGKGMIVFGWLILLGLLTFYFAKFIERQNNPNQDPTLYQTENYREVVLQRNRYGHYIASGEINNEPVTFLLDTGATRISVPAEVAGRLGLKPGAKTPVMTANGRIEVYSTSLREVNLGGIKRHNVSASINPHMPGDEVLLGMSFLRHLDFSQQGDQLLLRQY